MLWKRKSEEEENKVATDSGGQGEPSLKLKGAAAPAEAARPATPAAEPPRRPMAPPEIPGTVRQPTRPGASSSSAADGKKLIVGRDIVLNGEITSCEKLVIEGRVQANVTDCKEIVIAQSGAFKGSAEIESAEISGHFQGSLTVKDRLFIRTTGRVEGEIRYGKLEIECGGELSGNIRSQNTQQNLAIGGD